MLQKLFHKTFIAAVLYAGWLGQVAHGVAQFNPPESELQLLPPYCATVAGPAGQRQMDAAAQKWLQILGPEYYHIHHHCDALWHWNLAQRTFGQAETRFTYLKRSLGGFEYVESRARPDFVLNAEIAYFKGRVLLEMGEVQAALASFGRSIKFQPGYSPPYAALADYYLGAGEKGEARKILDEGLQHAPDAEPLKRRLSRVQ